MGISLGVLRCSQHRAPNQTGHTRGRWLGNKELKFMADQDDLRCKSTILLPLLVGLPEDDMQTGNWSRHVKIHDIKYGRVDTKPTNVHPRYQLWNWVLTFWHIPKICSCWARAAPKYDTSAVSSESWWSSKFQKKKGPPTGRVWSKPQPSWKAYNIPQSTNHSAKDTK